MKGAPKILIISAAVIAALLLSRNMIARAAVTGGVKAVTGLPVQVRSMDIGLFNTAVGIKGLKVNNPSGFPEPLMLDMPEALVDYKLGAFIQGKAHLERVRLDLAEFRVIKSADGKLNVQQIKGLESGKAEQKPAQKPGKAPQLQIDVLELKVGKVVYKDYTTTPPSTREFNVNIDEKYEHITNPAALAGLIVSRALMKTSIAQLANFDVAGLQNSVKDAMKASTKELEGLAAQGAKEVEKLTGDAAREAVRGAGDTTKKAVDEVTGGLKKVFGN